MLVDGKVNKIKKLGHPFIIMNKFRNLVLGYLILLVGAACAGGGIDVFPVPEIQNTPYVPPTVHSRSTPLALPADSQSDPSDTETQPEEIKITPTPNCEPHLTFITDLTIPDATVVEPGQTLDKRWQVENSGTCNWDMNYRLALIAGPDLGASANQALYPARSSTQAMIRIIFTAPDEPGVQRSAWQAQTPQGEPFGDPIFIEIIVQEPAPAESEG